MAAAGRESEDRRHVQLVGEAAHQVGRGFAPLFFAPYAHEISRDDAPHGREAAAAPQRLEHAVDVVDALAHVLQEQEDGFRAVVVQRRAVERGENREVAAQEHAPGRAFAVERMGCRAVAVEPPEEGVAQREGRGVAFEAVGAEEGGHRAVDRLHAQPPERIVHDREVAEAREPLGVGAQRCQVRVVEGPQGAVAAPEKEDGPKVRVVDHALQVGAPYAVGGIEPAARGAVKVLAAPRVQPPAAQHVEAFLAACRCATRWSPRPRCRPHAGRAAAPRDVRAPRQGPQRAGRRATALRRLLRPSPYERLLRTGLMSLILSCVVTMPR